MATLREYFDTDVKDLAINSDWKCRDVDGQVVANVNAKIAWDFEANAKFWYFYVSPRIEAQICVSSLLAMPEVLKCKLSLDKDDPYVENGFGSYSERANSKTLSFTHRVHVYVDADLTLNSKQELNVHA